MSSASASAASTGLGRRHQAFVGDRQPIGGDRVIKCVRFGRVAHGGDHVVAETSEGDGGEQAEATVRAGDEDAGHGTILPCQATRPSPVDPSGRR